mmetsp:Transcript_11066/g.31038  ORF Transcript_11066/g.31038 Transcript_11066/m.31038 type:complete len:162 (-) Transcript_11066:309-794(-)|eukprot:CAMPEP_0119122698 /NCGR_PEP_ID=MMETSP1310-20130426/2883_1 /TAXON_ID=464262 /ORGANISM="Genus nov. species nov., Strain RCC2339" /LENGTH=161 /DNA_ID=CAMNT_0007112397 /DNA_START=110 /DNA_END=595 /DNA_ORIENTATION=+
MMAAISNRSVAGVMALGLLLASGVMLNILACSLYSSWWSFFVVVCYVAAPLPDFAMRHIRCICGGYCEAEEDGFTDGDEELPPIREGLMDAAYFLTGALVASGLLLPLVLGHTHVISTIPMLMSLVGGVLVYIAIAVYLHVYHERNYGEDDGDGVPMATFA